MLEASRACYWCVGKEIIYLHQSPSFLSDSAKGQFKSEKVDFDLDREELDVFQGTVSHRNIDLDECAY